MDVNVNALSLMVEVAEHKRKRGKFYEKSNDKKSIFKRKNQIWLLL